MLRRRLVLVALVLAVLTPSSGFGQTPGDAPAAPADTLRTQLETIRKKHDLPALGGAIVTAAGVEGVWVTGARTFGGAEAVTTSDLWHLGSCTKSMTATLIALLVERGDLSWDATLPQLLPEFAKAMNPAYADVTLVDLLAHRAGVPAMTEPDRVLKRCSKLKVSPTEQRRELTRAVLSAPPKFPPKGKCNYSNAGLIIAGYIVERTTGKPWEQSIRELLFVPLGITTAGFGSPGTPDRVDQPRGHDDRKKPIPPGPDADNPPIIGPAGAVHMSLGDWAKYLQLHLRGAKGDVQVGAITLHAATMARLHTPWPADDVSYGYGWLLPKRDWAGGDHTVLTHSGSNTMWFCVCWLDPATSFGVLVVTNIAGSEAAKGADEAAALLLKTWIERRNSAESKASSPAPRREGSDGA